MDRLKYYRSQIVPFDQGTMVYWAERHDGKSFDIDPSDIPIGALVEDMTHDHVEVVQYLKTAQGFRRFGP